MSALWDRRAAAFDEENPIIYETLRGLALKAVRHGRRRLGIGQLWEILRWEMSLRTTESQPKLNNNYRAYYSRKLMANEPELAGIFQTRGGASSGIADGLTATLPDASQYDEDDYHGRRAA